MHNRQSVFPLPTRVKRRTEIATLTDIQREVVEYVALHPGATIIEVSIGLGRSHSGSGYHLRTVARLGLVEQVRDGRQVRHFRLPKSSKKDYLMALLRDPTMRDLLTFLCTHPVERMSINQIAKATHLNFHFVRRACIRLEDMGLATFVRRSYRYRLAVSPDLRTAVASRLGISVHG